MRQSSRGRRYRLPRHNPLAMSPRAKRIGDVLLAATLRSLSEADREEEEKPNQEINLRIFGGITASEKKEVQLGYSLSRRKKERRFVLEKMRPNNPEPNAAPLMMSVVRGSLAHNGVGKSSSSASMKTAVVVRPTCSRSTPAARSVVESFGDGALLTGSEAGTLLPSAPIPAGEEEEDKEGRSDDEDECRTRFSTGFFLLRPQPNRPDEPEAAGAAACCVVWFR